MQTPAPSPNDARALQAALARLQEIVLDGLRHGFFDCSVSCELVQGKKRRLVIRAGKSHQFTIPEDELLSY